MRFLSWVCVSVIIVGVGCKANEAEPPSHAPPNTDLQQPRATPNDEGTRPAATRPKVDVTHSACFKRAGQLTKRAKSCGIDMGDRTPLAICDELLNGEQFADEQAVGRLDIFMEGGCATLRTARAGDRI